LAHGKETTFAVRHRRQNLYRATMASRTAKKPLPSMALPYDLCRAVSHGKTFAVHIASFAAQIVAQQSPFFP
jgi:hypothetical protein